MPSRKFSSKALLIVLLLSLVSGACRFTFDPPMPPGQSTPPAATPTLYPGADLPLPAPRLLARQPERGESLAPDAPIQLVFDQPMDPASVTAAFAISPTVAGEFLWPDARTLNFVPAERLARAARYEITVGAAARNAEGAVVADPIRFAFQTVGHLAVGEVQPLPDATDVTPDTTVTIVFNRAVVPLTGIEQQAGLPQPLSFDPPVAGQGEWLNTSIYRFVPAEGFLPATEYEARIAPGLADVSGGMLESAYSWRFTTQRPQVIAWSPYSNAEHIGPGEVITVTFNQPMDHASVEAALTFALNGQPAAGRFTWSGGETPSAPESVVFTPAQPLPRNAVGRVVMGATARARASEMTLPGHVAWSFQTVRSPGLLSVTPADGARNVDPLHTDVLLDFASPMVRDALLEHLTIIPEPTRVYSYWRESDTRLRLRFTLEPATTYEVRLDAAMPDLYGERLGETVRTRFTTGNLPPSLYLNTQGGVGTFNAYQDTHLYVSHRNLEEIRVQIYAITPETMLALHGYGSYNFRNDYRPAESDLVRDWVMTVNNPLNVRRITRVDVLDAAGAQLPPGIYYVVIIAPGRMGDDNLYPQTYTFVRSRLNLTLKQGTGDRLVGVSDHPAVRPGEYLVWATDLASGQPVSGLAARFYDTSHGWHSESRTDRQGLARGIAPRQNDVWDDLLAVTGTPGAEDFAIAFNQWDYGIRPWNFNLQSDYGGNGFVGYLYTDRPIYRPAQVVYFKGILRADADAHYFISERNWVQVKVTDPQGKEIYDEVLPLNEMGSFFGELTLDAEAPLGHYYIQALDTEGGDYYTSASFQVAEYRKPEFQVSVQTDRAAYLNGETIHTAAEAAYYFGGAVVNAPVQWSVLSAGYVFQYRCPSGETCPQYSWRDYDWRNWDADGGGYGRLIAQGEATTDGAGRVTFPVAADISGETDSRTFTIEASVTDLNNQQVSNRATTIVHRGAFYVGLAQQGRVVEVGKPKEIAVLTVDWDSQPVRNVPVQVVFLEQQWYNVRQQADDGAYYWEWTLEETPVYTVTVTTDARGKATAAFTPETAGSYKALAEAVDQHGNVIRSSTYLWVWGGTASWRRESTNRIDLIVDRDSYDVGDVAEILIPSPYTGTVKALVTLERGHLLEAQVYELRSNSEVIRIPITEEHIPNLFVSVILVQGSAQTPEDLASFKMGQVMLPVSVERKQLHITLTPDRALAEGGYYRPRETAIYNVQVTDYAGQPVEAELSLRLADLAVLALADETGPTLLEHFWSQRGLAVRTSLPLAVAMEAYNRELAPLAKGGGGGDMSEGFIRTNFADTAFWEAVVRTDAQGRARVEVKLPDNLTTWRMQARGVTAETLVGRAEVDIRSTLDLLVRPLLPRFFVIGDRAEIATIVHNSTDAALEVAVTLAAAGLAVDGPTVQTVNVPAGGEVKVVWPVTVQAVEEVAVKMEARGGGFYDGRQDTLPVYRYTTPEVVGTAGRLAEAGLRQELIVLPPKYEASQGELTLQVDGSLTAATQDALTYLEHFPYECAEQTVSRFLPNVLTYQALTELGDARPELKAELTEQVGVALQRLYAQQHYDGGWGWWLRSESNPYLTAYALHGMLEAHRAGFAVDAMVMQNAANFVRANIPTIDQKLAHWQANRIAYQLYALGEYAQLMGGPESGELGLAIRLFEHRRLLDRYGKATLAVALGLLEPEEPSRVNTLLSDLRGEAVYSATGVYWEEAQPDYWNMNTDIRSTAIVIWALARHQPESDLLPNAVRWLMTVRQGDYWESTNTTAWSLMALTAYMRASGELQGDYSYTVALNGRVLLQGDVNRENLAESRRVQIEVAELLADQGNRLFIERAAPGAEQTGAGQLYYTAHLRYFLPAAEVEALDRGIVVARQYSLADAPDASISTAQVGDVIRVKLTIVVPHDLHYVVVEDPLPAGCEAVDLGLKTTSIVGQAPEIHNLTLEQEDTWYRWYGWGWWWFSHAEIRDEKVAIFADYLPRGTYEYSYMMRASVPGVFNVMPTTAYPMYFPETFGRSDGRLFTVGD